MTYRIPSGGECWLCRVKLPKRTMKICGACFQDRYQPAPSINGKPALRRRNTDV